MVFGSKYAVTVLRPNSSSAHPTHFILPPLVPTHRLELALLCRLCSSRHLQMTQQLTHLLHKHTHTLIHTHAAASTCCTEGGLRRAETMCSDPARPHPRRIQHTLGASAETPALIPSSWLCLSTHLPVFRSLPPPPSTLLSSHFHTLLPEKCFFVLLKILYTLQFGRLAHR